MRASTSNVFKPTAKTKPDIWSKIGIQDTEVSVGALIHKGFDYTVALKLMDVANINQVELHRITHIPLSTLKLRIKGLESFTLQESDVLYRLISILDGATRLFEGDFDKASLWICEPVYGLGGKSPSEMVSTTADFQTVLDLIGQLEHGVIS